MAFQSANYQVIGQLLANLIRDAQAAVWQLGNDERRQAQTWLAWTYQLTAATAFKLGDAQLGWVAADRGIQVAEQATSRPDSATRPQSRFWRPTSSLPKKCAAVT